MFIIHGEGSAQFGAYEHFDTPVVGAWAHKQDQSNLIRQGGEQLYKAWEQDVIDLRGQGKSWVQTAREIQRRHRDMQSLTDLAVIRKCRNVLEKQNRRLSVGPAEAISESQSQAFQKYHSDGTIESVCLIELWDGEELTPEKILAFHKLDPEKWTVISYTNNIWHMMMGKDYNNDRKQMYQSKVTARPKADGLSVSDVDSYFQRKSFTGKPVLIPTQYSSDGENLEVCVPDLHTGLLAWARETGEDYDIHIARDAFIRCITDIKERCVGRRFKRIYLVTLGDLLHTDNDSQTTTKGTFQQADGRIAKIFDYALDMLIDGLDILGDIAPVEIVYLCGNHDRTTGYMLIKALEMAYRRDGNFVFDVSPNPQKFRLIGCNLIGWTHGDMSKKNMGLWLQDRARREYGLARFAEVHVGHLHSESRTETYRTYQSQTTYDEGGIVVRHLPTISNSSAWEHHAGYPFGNKTMMCFVWNEQSGLRETWYSNL